MKTTSDELLMYEVIKNLECLKVPIVFKGGLITKAILNQNNQDEYIRTTKDIDANWIGREITMNDLCDIINKALSNVDNTLKAVSYREFDSEKSAGIKVVNENEETVFKFDIDVNRPVAGISSINIDSTEIRCVDAKQIIADKICAISGDKLFRRTKDLVDLYALSCCISFDVDEIKNIAEKTHHSIGDFKCFLERKADIEHAYEKLMGMYKKPDFEDVYERVGKISSVFIAGRQGIWNGDIQDWQIGEDIGEPEMGGSEEINYDIGDRDDI